MKIDKLTGEQEKVLVKTKNDWLRLAFEKNKDGINEPLFEEGINWLYQDLLKKEKPKIVYHNSWTACLIEIAQFQKESQKNGIVLNPLRAEVRKAIQSTILNPLNEQITVAVGKLVLKTVEDTTYVLEGLIQHNIWMTISNAVAGYVLNKEGNPTNDFSDYNGWDNFRMLAGYDFFERIGVFQDHNFTQLKKLNQSNCFTIYEYENIVFAIQPPVVIERNNNGELHSLYKRAFEFSGGFGYYFINGQLMPDWIFMGFGQNDFDEMEDKVIKEGMQEILKHKAK